MVDATERERLKQNADGCLASLQEQLEYSTQRIAAHIGRSVPTIDRWLRRHGLTDRTRPKRGGAPPQRPPRKTARAERAGATITGDNAVLVGRANPMSTSTLDPDTLLREAGLDPDDWTYQPTLNRWDVLAGNGIVTTMAQLKLVCKRRVRVDLLTPARAPGWTPPQVAPRIVRVSEPETVMVCSDPHWPYVQPELHAAMLRMLADLQPQRGYDLGDGLDLPNPSRHRTNPAFNATAQQCLDGEYGGWLDRVAASPGTKWKRCPGNHDVRIRNEQLERTASVYGIRRAQVEAEIAEHGEFLPQFDIGVLLRLDELGIEMVRPERDGEYHAAHVRIAPGLLAGHGTKTGKHGGATKAGDRLTCSWMQGHDHKQALAYLTRYDDELRAGDAALCSVGTLAHRDLGYVEHAEVQQGLATVMVWPDGRFHIELARFDAGELVWRDRRY